MTGPKTFPPVIGGIETHVYELSKRLASAGNEVKVVVPGALGDARREEIEGVEVVRVPSVRNKYALKLSMMLSVAKHIRSNEGFVVHAHDATSGFIAGLFADRRRFVYTVHGLAFHKEEWPTPFRQGIRLMRMTALKAAAHVFCTDERTAEEMRRMRQDIEILSSGVEPSQYSKEAHPRPREFPRDRFIVLFVGRFERAKGVEVLLNAIESLPKETRARILFAFVGEGPLSPQIRAAAKELGCILHLGVVEHSRIAPYFVHADAFVLPSLTEGVPLSLLEGMASGVPTIASCVGGVATEFTPEVVWFVEPEDVDALASSIAWMEGNREQAKALGERGKQYVADRFSWQKVVERVSRVYEGLRSA